MPESPEELYARVRAVADERGGLPVPDVAGWDTFPFEAEGLRVVPLRPPELPEPPRYGEGGTPCRGCDADVPALWRDDHWRLRTWPQEPAGAPLALVLEPYAHVDLPTLPDDHAAELGRLVVHLSRAVEALPHVARCHVMRVGDGGAHLHVFLFARPAGFLQLRGSNFVLWDDVLPPVPVAQRDADARAVAEQLVTSYGGAARA